MILGRATPWYYFELGVMVIMKLMIITVCCELLASHLCN